MAEHKLLKNIEHSLLEILKDLSEGRTTDEEVLKLLNEAAHYTHQQYWNEMLFIEAIKHDLIPKSWLLVQLIFRDLDDEYHIYSDLRGKQFKNGGTRREVLVRLNLKESLKMYDLWLDQNDPQRPNDKLHIKPQDIIDLIQKEMS